MAEHFAFEASAENLRALLDQSLTGVFIVFSERIGYANKTFQEMLGYAPDELMRMDPWSHVHPEEREEIRELARHRIEGAESRNVYETRMLRKDGAQIWVEVRATPIKHENQPAVLVNIISIGERKLAEQRLLDSEARFRSMFEQAPIGIYRAAPDGRLLMANAAMMRMLGHTGDAQSSLNRDVFEPTFPKSEYQRLMEKDGEIRGLESAWIRQDNRLIDVREYARSVFDEKGRVLYHDGAAEDITERKRAEQALQLYAQRLGIMREVERAILTASSSEAIVHAVIPGIRRLVPCQRATLLLFDRARACATVVAVDQDAGEDFEPVEGACLPLDDLSSAEESDPNAWKIIEDLNALEQPKKVHLRLARQGLRSVLSVPIHIDGELVGELNLASRKAHAFDLPKQKIAGEVAGQLAVGLKQAGLLGDLRQQRERLQGLIEHLPEGLVLLDVERRILLANPMARRLLPLLTSHDPLHPTGPHEGQVLETLGGRDINPLGWKEGEVLGPLDLAVGDKRIEVTGHPVPLADLGGCVLVIRDVSREREVMRQLQQQERLAAIGELAGGVAHDFNNLLTAIDGFANLLRRKVPDDHPGGKTIAEIKRVCERGGALTRRLLAFSRRHDPAPERVDLNAVIRGVEEMLRRLLGSPVRLRLELSEDLPPLLGHAEQLEQVLINLSINARDAMPEGGELRIETAPERGAEPWIRLEVSDTGSGMDEATRQRIFEPFFTTREDAGGTGLGLSTVQGIVHEAGGRMSVESEPGRGSRFKILLPALSEPRKS